MISASKGLSRVFSNTTVQMHLWCPAFFIVQLSHPYLTTGKIKAFTIQKSRAVCSSVTVPVNSQFSSVTQSCPTVVTPWPAVCQASLSITNSRRLLKFIPLSRRCHPAISSSVVPFSSCPQSFPASGSFPVSQLFTSGGQNIGVSASASVLPVNWTDLL